MMDLKKHVVQVHGAGEMVPWALAEKQIKDLLLNVSELREFISDLACNSEGIAGYHLNGEIAPWDYFEVESILDRTKNHNEVI